VICPDVSDVPAIELFAFRASGVQCLILVLMSPVPYRCLSTMMLGKHVSEWGVGAFPGCWMTCCFPCALSEVGKYAEVMPQSAQLWSKTEVAVVVVVVVVSVLCT
jgi:hypothetical protein